MLFFYQVKSRVDAFKEHLPLIGALFNPGLRDRHWEKMSSIANQELKPTEVMVYIRRLQNILLTVCVCV